MRLSKYYASDSEKAIYYHCSSFINTIETKSFRDMYHILHPSFGVASCMKVAGRVVRWVIAVGATRARGSSSTTKTRADARRAAADSGRLPTVLHARYKTCIYCHILVKSTDCTAAFAPVFTSALSPLTKTNKAAPEYRNTTVFALAGTAVTASDHFTDGTDEKCTARTDSAGGRRAGYAEAYEDSLRATMRLDAAIFSTHSPASSTTDTPMEMSDMSNSTNPETDDSVQEVSRHVGP
ncbi:hypothetical protein NM688_g3221 [Phlebia brevispora]|uniref:Uncharacterized protein n=1 Tax=Phlebia brevispora TaxID=194682 RepID=A0ACC1T6S5_9APHY|nr:hypothetical protein NM688_g3221 [Phlebia brevispora]